MVELLQSIWANDLYRKLILSGLILLGQSVARRLLLWILLRRVVADSPYIYPLRKAVGYVVSLLATILLFGLWVERLGDLSVALGILAAGLAFALQEVIGSFAGWLTILSGRPFSVGDRIETGGIRGDVIDVGVLRTTLMEIGNWLSGDHNTGRIVTVSNAFIFKEPLFNYSAHLRYIWDEIIIPITYTSNVEQAAQMMLVAVQQHPQYQELLPQAQAQRLVARRKFAVKITPLEPRVFVKLTDNWIELGLIYPVDTDNRRTFRSDISKIILARFAESGIVIASQTVAIVQFPTAADSQLPESK
jgi:small-conductance mechanosensitive channel